MLGRGSSKEGCVGLAYIYLGHLFLGLSCQEAQIVDLILHHKVLLLALEILQPQDEEINYYDKHSSALLQGTRA